MRSARSSHTMTKYITQSATTSTPFTKRRSRPGKHAATLSVSEAMQLQKRKSHEHGATTRPRVTNAKKSVRFAADASIVPAGAASHADTWYHASDYSHFLQDRRSALSFLLHALVKNEAVHASDYVGMEQQLCQEQFIARKLQCLQYVQLVVCQQYMKDDVQEIQAATKSFTMESSNRAFLRAASAFSEN
ncbi:hypothetical protein MPSEU_000730500 [Mayamaea pseudoterrestris]|nr:hypothetical protein MPSEU_000730500 [Mayamaea pseudoterrestris]